MKPNLLKKLFIASGFLALMLLGYLAYGSYTAIKASTTADTCIRVNNGNNEMPWESMARQLVGAVSFQ